MQTVADVVIHELQTAGVRMLFGVPGGGGNLDLIAAAGRAGLPFILTSTETAAVLSAVGQAEVTGRPTACLTTLGPGAASAANGIACALLDRAPVIIFTDNYATAAGGVHAHQLLDQHAMFAPITRRSDRLGSADPEQVIGQAVTTALESPGGPVHIECPGDALSATVMKERGRLGSTSWGYEVLSEAGLHILHAHLAQAKRPLLLVGLGARQAGDADAIRRFCEDHRVPAMVTYKAKGVVPDEHEWFAGVFTHAVIEQRVIDESDLLIGVGLDPVELLPRPWKRSQPIVGCSRSTMASDHVPFAAQLPDDVPSALAHIASQIPTSTWDASAVRRHVDAQRRAIDIPADGMTAQQVVSVAAAKLASTCRVTVDAGAHMLPATMLWPVREPNGMLISNGLSTMGFALPAAIGAALIDRPRPVVALTGDGGLLMCVGELLTAVRERLRVIVIVFDDASLSLIEIKQQARQLAPAGVALGAVDWPLVAAGFGVPAFAADTEAELTRAIDEALACDGPCLISAKIDRSNYAATLRAVRG